MGGFYSKETQKEISEVEKNFIYNENYMGFPLLNKENQKDISPQDILSQSKKNKNIYDQNKKEIGQIDNPSNVQTKPRPESYTEIQLDTDAEDTTDTVIPVTKGKSVNTEKDNKVKRILKSKLLWVIILLMSGVLVGVMCYNIRENQVLVK